jgi:hypothetical protein
MKYFNKKNNNNKNRTNSFILIDILNITYNKNNNYLANRQISLVYTLKNFK